MDGWLAGTGWLRGVEVHMHAIDIEQKIVHPCGYIYVAGFDIKSTWFELGVRTNVIKGKEEGGGGGGQGLRQ